MVAVLDRRVDDHEQHLFEGSGYVVGRFDCPPDAGRWQEVNWVGSQPVVAFGSAAVRVGADGAATMVCTPNELVLYDRWVAYRREAVSRRGDRSTFIGIGDQLASDLGLDRPERPRITQRASSAAAYLVGRLVMSELAEPDPDLLAVDEWCLAIVQHAIEPRGAQNGTGGGSVPTAIDAVRALIADDPHRPWTLDELAGEVHYSPWFLSRRFKALTGSSLSGYRQQLRLRASLDAALRRDSDLSAVAADHGFSSHSHYTRAFRTAFGCAPSAVRSRPGRIQLASS